MEETGEAAGAGYRWETSYEKTWEAVEEDAAVSCLLSSVSSS